MSAIYIVANGSGQSGKSTTALNLALCFATLARRTLLVNLSHPGWVSSLCKGDEEKSRLNLFLDYTESAEGLTENTDYDQMVVNCPVHKSYALMTELGHHAEVIVPVELEYYGLNGLPLFLKKVLKSGVKVRGILPVMWRKESENSNAVLLRLQQEFGKEVFLPAIHRNYYLARQKDFSQFDLPALTEKAAVTYLNLATELIKMNV